ncbi:alpha/beta hydrolase family protein [Methanosarcina sp.]|uniref:alpha/beta hydrolase family protein n=1 Tax=Methanosarcina sp. TaxID=2213 RepID=UPI003BB687D5
MNNKTLIYAVLLIMTVACPGCISQQDRSQTDAVHGQNIENIEDIKGLWIGNMEVPGGVELRILFNISTRPDGSVNATMDSLDQGARGIPVEKITYKDSNLSLEVKSVRGVFEGTLNESGKTIEGEWKQSGSTLPLVLTHIDKTLPELRREQDPVKPYPYAEEEVVFENKEAGIKLAGTLTLPESEGLFPAVLLISGSGPQNRDEEIMGHRPFLVLSDYLTRQGIAVLRFDDRSVGGSTGNFSKATTEDFAGDVLSGIEYLKSRKDIDSSKIGLIGHSEGGLIAPLVAVESNDVAFIVLLAAPGVTGEEIILSQGELIARAEGVDNETIARNKAFTKEMFSVVKEEQNDTIARKKLKKLLKSETENKSEEEKQHSNFSEANLEPQIQGLLSPWMRFFLTYDPIPTLMKVKCPVLAINGEKDLQVPPEENLLAIENALKAGSNENYTVKELPGLNHLFQTTQTGSPTEYSKIEETISPDALELIGNWISEHT